MAIILLKGEYRIHSKANLNNVLTVKCYGESPKFERFLQKYAVA